uniref:Globin n=1 Tax=Angiostrongylus cantonensis TaxID=6313 RepID=A0A0K0DM68_ANGCA
MHEILMPKQYTKNDDEREFVLRLLASRFVSFFHGIIMDCLETTVFSMLCFLQQCFQLVYWDVFCLAMLEELENRGGVPREELRAWQTLLHIINENMLAGYLDAKQEGRE